MPYEPYSLQTDLWNAMQKPKHKGQAGCDLFWSLMAAIDQEWYVTEPVLKINRTSSGGWSYMFYLHHTDHPQGYEIVLPEFADVTRLLQRNGYIIETK